MSRIKNKKFWIDFRKKYGKADIQRIEIPMDIYGNFNYHFFLYDEKGVVQDGAISIEEAIQKHNDTGLYITKVWEKGEKRL